jgi:superfamily II DNA or RNA helicase/HKD family nuclease/diadenosine tetraphosphate (Ap4A) HIT family hydrolase
LVKGIWDAFPVTEGHLLITPHRHVAAWRDLHASERQALMAALDEAHALLGERFAPDGYNVGFNDGAAAGQTIPHFHLHVIPRRVGDMADPRGGVRHVIPARGNYLTPPQPITLEPGDAAAPLLDNTPHRRALIAGGEDGLLQHLTPYIDRASRVDAAVSFVMASGVSLIQPHLQDLLDRGGALRFLTGDYLDVTDPAALRRLLDLNGDVTLAVFEAGQTVFHPKAWVFHFPDGAGVALVGSSNLSDSALRRGVEWNLRLVTADQQGGWRDALGAFEALLTRPEVKPLTHTWVESYESRRRADTLDRSVVAEVGPEPARPVPFPHLIQQRALAALEETRAAGYKAGLVVLATGLGKTWLSAFDTDRPEFRRVLFVAHREEILNQAQESFRVIRPNDRFGRYSDKSKDWDADVLFASVQTLGKAEHLRRFEPDAFDYIIIDEFHHAAARTYRTLIDYFRPKFLLGMTATPERTDGGDLLGLCQENLVFEFGLASGIDANLLCPFHYFGVPDEVEYSNIPWRSAGFDETALTNALATQARAQNALEQLGRRGGGKVLAFCCSQKHADFMSDFFSRAGRRCVAVHSGSTSAPRSTALQALEAGDLDIVCAVDMFNEGVDVPSIDTILMLRPTASAIVWTQQMGRGLRRSAGKDHLSIIDYIGNHRTFLNNARVLLDSDSGDRSLALALEKARDGHLSLPAGCEVTYDLEALSILKKLLRRTSVGDALEAYFIDFKERLGLRPTALEIYHAGFDPKASGHGSWFQFVRRLGDLDANQARVLAAHHEFLDEIARTPMTRSYKMVLLQATQEANALPGSISLDDLATRFQVIARRNPRIAADIGAPVDDLPAVRRSIAAHPITAWLGRLDARGKPFFTFDGEVFETAFDVEPALKAAFTDMVRELIDWRLAQYLDRGGAPADATPEAGREAASGDGAAEAAASLAVPWREYMREEIPPLFGLTFNAGAWNQGFIVHGRHAFVLVTLEKANLISGRSYDDRFLSADRFQWHSQNRATRNSTHGRIIGQVEQGFEIHLFVRAAKLRGGRGSPFYYCGDVDFESWTGDAPIIVTWRLREPVPEHLRRLLGVP